MAGFGIPCEVETTRDEEGRVNIAIRPQTGDGLFDQLNTEVVVKYNQAIPEEDWDQAGAFLDLFLRGFNQVWRDSMASLALVYGEREADTFDFSTLTPEAIINNDADYTVEDDEEE